MKRIVLAAMMMAAAWSTAEAKGGKGATAIPPDYDYSREKASGYKKDYCEDSIGNHIYCTSMVSGRDGAYTASWSRRSAAQRQ